MKLPVINFRAVAIITIAISVFGLVMSPVSAAGAFSPSGEGAGSYVGNVARHHEMNSTEQAARLEVVLANLSQQGIDVSPARADLAAGNITAAGMWLTAYRNDHPGILLNGKRPYMFNGARQYAVNGTRQSARLQTVLTNLGKKGVDVGQALADLATGNITGTMKDLMAMHKDHPGMISNFNPVTLHKNRPGMMMNNTQVAARLQSSVTNLAQNGVDVSEIQSDLASGNLSAAMQWMAAYHIAHPHAAANVPAIHGGNFTQWQKGGFSQPHSAGFGNQTARHTWSPSPVQGA